MREQLDRRSSVDLVEHASELGDAGLLGVDYGKVDVRLSLSSTVRHVPFHLQQPNHARDARVRERWIDTLADLGGCCFAELTENAHYIQLSLGQVQISHWFRQADTRRQLWQ